ncbi:hypothetical protein [Streptomyces hoynatensis]|uniref:hypothetical protein n=1 Tax=Streptomyces hoynatensis TaxID=1141874 RepID=UPI0018823E93|nr:hypothetical protein [Streptomyces hoynatensis]
MRRPGDRQLGREAKAQAAAGIAQLEGYLLWQAELRGARAEGEDFATRLPSLSEAQRAEVAGLYAEERLRLAKRLLRGLGERSREFEEEYALRYRRLRQRLWCAAACACLAFTAFLLALSAMTLG